MMKLKRYFLIFSVLFIVPLTTMATTWNGTTWSAGAPTNAVDAVIASSVTPGAFTCANLTINSGVALTINSGVTVTVAGNITNNGNGLAGMGTIQFNKNASTVQLSGNAIGFEGIVDVVAGTTLNTNGLLTLTASTTTSYGRITGSTGVITGNVTVQKVLANTNAGWRQISLPVDAPLTSIVGIDLLNSSHPVAGQRNVFYYDPANGNPGPVSGFYAVGWTAPSNTDDETRAYTIFSDNSLAGLKDISPSISITGVPNQATYTINLIYNYDPASTGMLSQQRGWNFIPNRFASNIDVSVLINDANFGTTYKAVHVYDEINGQYVAINQSSRNTYNNTTSNSPLTSDLMPFQGFWVKATSTSQSIQVKMTHRSTDLSTSAVYTRRSPEQLRLHVADASGRADQVAVIFDETATEALDGEMDLFKLKSPNRTVPTLYCQEGDLELSANALPALNKARKVQLIFESWKKDSTYTFTPDLSAFNQDAKVQIEDKKTGRFHDLAEGAYQFVYDDAFGKDRFVLHFTQHEKSVLNALSVNDNGVAFSKNNTSINPNN